MQYTSSRHLKTLSIVSYTAVPLPSGAAVLTHRSFFIRRRAHWRALSGWFHQVSDLIDLFKYPCLLLIIGAEMSLVYKQSLSVMSGRPYTLHRSFLK